MVNDIKALTVTNFRSVQGTVYIPLSAPIVLIHGPNGAGKTSILSALELAMTGDVATMRREDDQFLKYLVHEGAEQAAVRLTGGNTNPEGGNQPGSMIVVAGQITGQPMLERSQAAFFAERCYLAQSVLSRLLEIYQHADPRADSHLTRFVKDLLGLDQLDALIDGLHAAGHVQRTKNLVPEFRASEDRCAALRAQRAEAETGLARFRELVLSQRQTFASLIAALPVEYVGPVPPLADMAQMKALLERVSEDSGLTELAQYRHELASIRNAWASLPRDPSANEREDAEHEEASASAAAHDWRGATGVEFEALLDQLRVNFSDLPSWASAGPLPAYDTAMARVQADLQRQNVVISSDRDAALWVQRLDEEIQKAEARVKLADEQIGTLAQDAGELARALAGITPHIHGQDCPVCGRDFGEVSAEPLLGHLQEKIALLTEQGGRLSALLRAKSGEVTRLASLQREREIAGSKQLNEGDRLAHQANVARLTSSLQTLSEWKNDIAAGSFLLRRHSDAQRRLSEARDRDRLATDLRRAAQRLAEGLGQPPLGDSESLAAALDRLSQYVTTEQLRLIRLQETRAGALKARTELLRTMELVAAHETSIGNLEEELRAAVTAHSAAERRMLQARAIAQAAREARTVIVRRVFNESLNALWHDLFVRLAPTEPFVPIFRLPETARGVVAALETVHRSGMRGGTPGTMLSAGNLNTAALTLFLALHLAVKRQVPWLVLDDPVQSMDEVHIAQFAALLRTVSKAHGRKVIIAVHDRALFDYLTLELSPAFTGDQLIAIELSRSASEDTIARPQFRTYERDDTFAA